MPEPFKPSPWAYEPQSIRRARQVSAIRAVQDRTSELVAKGDPLSLAAAREIARGAQRTPQQDSRASLARKKAVAEAMRTSITAPPPAAEGADSGILGGLADTFRAVVPQGVRDTVGNTLQSLTSGEQLLNALDIRTSIGNLASTIGATRELGRIPTAAEANVQRGSLGTQVGERLYDVPRVGGALRTAFDVGLAPTTIATAGVGGPVAGALRASTIPGRGALAAVADIGIGGGFKTKVAAQVAAALAGQAAGGAAQGAAERAGAPEWAQTGAGLAGNLVGGAAGIGAVGAARRIPAGLRAVQQQAVREALERAAPEAAQYGRATGEDAIPRRLFVQPEGETWDTGIGNRPPRPPISGMTSSGMTREGSFGGGFVGGSAESDGIEAAQNMPKPLTPRQIAAAQAKADKALADRAAGKTMTPAQIEEAKNALGRVLGATTPAEREAMAPWNRPAAAPSTPAEALRNARIEENVGRAIGRGPGDPLPPTAREPLDAATIMARARARAAQPRVVDTETGQQAIRRMLAEQNAPQGRGQAPAEVTQPPRVPGFPLDEGGQRGGADLPVMPGEAGDVPIGMVRARPERFQARDVAPGSSFDERRVQQLVEGWDRSRLDPIVVAPDPEGGYVVLSGHHRLEAANRVGETDIPVRVVDVNLSTEAGMQRAQREAILANFSVAEQNVRERVRAFTTLQQDGMSVDEIGQQARMSADRVQRTIDVGNAGPTIVDRVTANPALQDIAAEVGRFRRMHPGTSLEDAQGTFDALVHRGKGETLPSATAVRKILDGLAPAFENRMLPGFEGAGFGGDSTPLYAAVREGARLQDELTSAQRQLTQQINAVKGLGERAGIDVSGLEAAGEAELAAIRAKLANLEGEVLGRVRAQAEAAATPPRGQLALGQAGPEPVAQSAPVQTGPGLFDQEPPRPPRPPSEPPGYSDYGEQGQFPGLPPANEGVPDTLWGRIVEVANLPRTLMAAGDFSNKLRQEAMLAPRNPREWWRSLGQQIRALHSEEALGAVDRTIKAHADYPLLRRAGVYLAPISNVAEGALREESYAGGRLAAKIPGLGRFVRATERGFIGGLNTMRAEVFYKQVAAWRKAGVELTDERLKALGAGLNAFSGRGSMPRFLEQHAAAINAGFFAPRNFFGRLEANALVFNRDPAVRRFAAENLAAFYGTGAAILGLAAALGQDVELDPRSSDFGKLQLPNGQRIDFWAGNQQIARMAAQMAASAVPGVDEAKSARTGQTYQQDWQSTAGRFLRSKLAPVPGLATELITGADFRGEELRFEPKQNIERAISLVTPLFVADFYEALKAQGLVAGAVAAIGGGVGLGVGTYEAGPADAAAQELFGKPYARLTGPERGDLVRAHPEITGELIEQQKRLAGPAGQAAEVRSATRAQQQASDQQLLEGKLTRQQWQQQRQDRALKQRGALEALYGAADSISDAEAARDPLKRYLKAIADATDPATGAVDAGELEKIRAGWGPELNAQIDRSLGTNDTPLVRLYREAASAYYDLPRYKGYTSDEARQIDALWTLARAGAKSSEELDMSRSLRAVLREGGYDPRIVTGARRRIAGRLDVAPDRKRLATRDPLAAFFFGSKALSPSQRAQVEARIGERTAAA